MTWHLRNSICNIKVHTKLSMSILLSLFGIWVHPISNTLLPENILQELMHAMACITYWLIWLPGNLLIKRCRNTLLLELNWMGLLQWSQRGSSLKCKFKSTDWQDWTWMNKSSKHLTFRRQAVSFIPYWFSWVDFHCSGGWPVKVFTRVHIIP